MIKKITLLSTVAISIMLACNQPTGEVTPVHDDKTQEIQEISDENKTLITKQIVYDVVINDPEEEAWWYQNMKASNREKFIDLIFEAIKQGRLTAYQPQIGLPTNSKEYALTVDEFNVLLFQIDSILEDGVEVSGEKVWTVVENEASIDRVTFIEEWYFDETNLKMEKKVNGLAFGKGVYTDENELKGYKRLFYVWFEDMELVDIE